MSHLLFEKRNAYSPEMAIKLTEYLRQCDKDSDVCVIVITGAGDASNKKSAPDISLSNF